jgi:hypothetical protein
MIDEKTRHIAHAFCPAVGSMITGYTTAELRLEDGTWDPWPDLPVRLEWGDGNIIAVSWSKFDDLWLATDLSLPFDVGSQDVRWVRNSHVALDQAIGARISSVLLGRGEMSLDGVDIEVWTRLLVQLDDACLEVFNALDENGYDFHVRFPPGQFVTCT